MMSLARWFFIVAICLSLGACMSDTGTDEGDGKGDTPTPEKPQPPSPEEKNGAIISDPVIDQNQFPNVAGTIFGAWAGTEAHFENGMAYFTYLYFNVQSKMAIEQQCWVPGERIAVELLVPSTITTSKVIVSEALEKSARGEKVSFCEIRVQPEVIIYELSGNTLRLKRNSGSQESYRRFEY